MSGHVEYLSQAIKRTEANDKCWIWKNTNCLLFLLINNEECHEQLRATLFFLFLTFLHHEFYFTKFTFYVYLARYSWAFVLLIVKHFEKYLTRERASWHIGKPISLHTVDPSSFYWYKVKANSISIRRVQTSGNLELNQSHLTTSTSKDSIQKSCLDLLNKLHQQLNQ